MTNILSINPEKKELVLFTRRYKHEQVKLLKFYGQTLELQNQVKYRGVILDSKLN